jgi:hypothetical protein
MVKRILSVAKTIINIAKRAAKGREEGTEE